MKIIDKASSDNKYLIIFPSLINIIKTILKNEFSNNDNFDNNIEEYDEIIIGSPIWNDRLCSPINSVLDKLNLKNKKVVFILYSGSGKASKAKEFINKNYEAKTVVLKEPLRYPEELNKLKGVVI